MKIESIIRRPKGTEVTLDGRAYHFKPEVDGGPHVCEVKNEEHIGKLLAVREGFRIAKGDTQGDSEPPEQEQDEVNGGDGENGGDPGAVLTPGGDGDGEGDDSGPEDDDQGDDDGDAQGDDGEGEGAGDTEGGEGDTQGDDGNAQGDAQGDAQGSAAAALGAQDNDTQALPDREALAVEYQGLTGSRPHGKWGPERIEAELKELRPAPSKSEE